MPLPRMLSRFACPLVPTLPTPNLLRAGYGLLTQVRRRLPASFLRAPQPPAAVRPRCSPLAPPHLSAGHAQEREPHARGQLELEARQQELLQGQGRQEVRKDERVWCATLPPLPPAAALLVGLRRGGLTCIRLSLSRRRLCAAQGGQAELENARARRLHTAAVRVRSDARRATARAPRHRDASCARLRLSSSTGVSVGTPMIVLKGGRSTRPRYCP